MSRVKTFDSTGQAPSGRLYSGDLNAIQDQYADLSNFSQNHGVGTLQIGETGLQLLKFGSGEARLTGLFRADGIVRGLGGLFAGQFTTAERDAIAAGKRPYGLMILNTDEDQLEWNVGTDGSPEWMSVAMRGDGTHAGHMLAVEDSDPMMDVFMVEVTGDNFARFAIHAGGGLAWGPGNALHEVYLRRSAANELKLEGRLIAEQPAGQEAFGAKDAADTQHRFAVMSDGRLEWGPGGVTGRDVALYRPVANRLKLDDDFETLGLQVGAAGTLFKRMQIVTASYNIGAVNAGDVAVTAVPLPAGTAPVGSAAIPVAFSSMSADTWLQRPGASLITTVDEYSLYTRHSAGENPPVGTLTLLIFSV